jgi:hypothetical protein
MYLRQLANIFKNKLNQGYPYYNLQLLMKEYYQKINKEELEYFNFYANSKSLQKQYIYTQEEKNLTIKVIDWGKFTSSDIHGHGRQNCLFMPINGKIEQEIFPITRPFNIPDLEIINAGDTKFINNKIGFHKLTNIEKENNITLHFYWEN